MGGTTAKSCLIERRRARAHQHVRGRPHLPLQEGLRLPGLGAVGRPRRDRRRRRQRSPGSTSSACSRSAPSRRAPSPARPPTAAAARSRRSPTPTSCSACSIPASSSAATCRSTPRCAEAALGIGRRPLGLTRRRDRRRHPRDRQPEHGRRGPHARRRAGRRPPRRPVLAFGGAGPVHACGVAELLDSPRVDLPGQRQRAVGVRHAGLAGAHRPGPQSMLRRSTPSTPAERDALLDELRAEGRRVLAAAGVADDRSVPLRARRPLPRPGQRGHDLGRRGRRVAGRRRRGRRALRARYRRIYGLTIPDVRVEVVTWRLVRLRRRPTVEPQPSSGRAPGEPHGTRAGALRPRRRRGRHAGVPAAATSASGSASTGPAIVEERETTAVIRPGWSSRSPSDGSSSPIATSEEPRVSRATFDPIELEVLWQSLIATVNEQAKALQRAAFSPIVREAGDLANAVFDRRGRMVAQAVTGTPGHINSLARGAAAMLDEYPLDSLIDRRRAHHQRPVQDGRPAARRHRARTPCSANGRAIAFFGSTIHHTDVGGYGIGAGARDVFEEGLWIPICKLMHRRRAQRGRVEVHPLQRPPARPHGGRPARPDGIRRGRRPAPAGAVRPATGSTTSRRSPTRSSTAPRRRPGRRSATCPPARTAASAVLDLADGSRSTSSARSPSTPRPARSSSTTRARSDASPYGINVVKNYTHAYTTFTVRSVLNPEIPNNHGSLAPIKVEAPGGIDRQRRVAAAVHGPPRRRHVPAQRAAQGAGPDQARAGDGRGLRRRVDDAGQRQPRRRPPVHHGDVHLRRRRRRPGGQAGALGVLVPDRRRRGADRGRRGVGPDPVPAKALRPGSGGDGRRPAGSARRSSSPSTRRARGSSTR